MHRFSTLCLTLVLALFLCSASFSYADKKPKSATKDLSGIKQKIKAVKKKLSQTKKKHHDAADALKESETAISSANKKLYQIRKKQKQKKSALSKLKKQSLSINAKLSLQQKQLSNLLYQQYAQGNQSYLRLLLQNKNPSQISRDLKYQSYIAKAHAKLIDDMQASLSKVKKLNLRTTNALLEVSTLKKKQESERQTLRKQKTAKAKVLKKLSKTIKAQRGKIKKLTRDEKRLSQLVKKLAKITKSTTIKKSIKKNTSKVIAKNKQTPTSRYSGKKFASLKGKLRLPVRGDVMNRFGRKRKDSGLTWKGLFIRAKEGAIVKAVASGRVVFAEWMRGFGNLMIIDHGSGYMSLYGSNQTLLKNVGQDVKGGDAIAAVGNTGGNKNDGLYYELRKQSKPFDPLRWSNVR